MKRTNVRVYEPANSNRNAAYSQHGGAYMSIERPQSLFSTSFICPELPIAIALSHSDTITQTDPRSSINCVGQNATTQSFGNNPQEGPAGWRKLEQEDRAVREYRHRERS